VSGELYARLHSTPKRVGSNIDLAVPNRWQKGQVFRYSLLYTTGGSVPHRPASDYQKVVGHLGLKGTFPSIRDLHGGTLGATPVIATIRTTPESVVRFSTVKNASDPIGLTIRMKGFNPNWQVVYALGGSTKWRYFGELDGYFYMNLYTNRSAYAVVAGHPVLADREDVRIRLDDPLGKQSAFEVYNPTGSPVTVGLRTNKAFLNPQSVTVKLGAYESKRVRFR